MMIKGCWNLQEPYWNINVLFSLLRSCSPENVGQDKLYNLKLTVWYLGK